MNRYINACNLLTKIKAYRPYQYLGEDALSYAIKMVELEPSADVRENVRGEWIPVTNGRGGFECSKCHDYAPSYQNGDDYLSHFCPNCGAEMRGEQE